VKKRELDLNHGAAHVFHARLTSRRAQRGSTDRTIAETAFSIFR
jgi:hypothetical protein